ncbi:PP2C family protein-serine/threonine phosphatase [Nocardioides montaniterrae]
MSTVELHHGAATDVGLVRKVNEDSYLAVPPVFVVADGMGGHQHGDVASRFVIEEFERLAERGVSDLDDPAAAQAVATILAMVQQRIAAYDASSGTTAVIAVLLEGSGVPRWLLANVGDSRVYRYDEGELQQVSVDHSVVQEMVDSGRLTAQQAHTHPNRNVITRALGGADNHEPDFFLLPLVTAERIMLCSDGVHGMIDDVRMAEILKDSHDPRNAAERLVEAAVAAGGRDNATAVVIDVVGLAHDTTYDSDAERLSLEEKLGALP